MSDQKNGRRYVAIFIKPETRRRLALAKVMHNYKSYDDLLLDLLKAAGFHENH